MHFVARTTDLAHAINSVQKAISHKTALKILDGILIEAYDQIKLTGYNNEMAIEYILEGQINQKGVIVVGSRIFGDIIRKLPDGEAFITLEDQKIIIDSKMSHFEIPGIEASGYPKVPQIREEQTIEIAENDLRNLIKDTLFAISTDQNKKNFTGSLFEFKDQTITVVSLDGYRLALSKSLNLSTRAPFSVIVPGYALNELSKILQNTQEIVQIHVSTQLMAFEMKHWTMITRLIESEFIQYQNVIPAQFETRIQIQTKELLLSLERASLFGYELKKVPVKFQVMEDTLLISSNTPLGNVRELVQANIFGDRMEIGFNPKYLMDALRVIEDDKVEICLTSPIGPCIIKPLEGDSFLYMVLPVKLAELSMEE